MTETTELLLIQYPPRLTQPCVPRLPAKYTSMMHDRAPWVEAYTTCALSKAPHSNAARLEKCHQETAMVKDHCTHKRMRLETSQQLDKELSTLAPTRQIQLSTTTSSMDHPLPPGAGGSTLDTWPPLATDPDIHMLNADDSIINDLYK